MLRASFLMLVLGMATFLSCSDVGAQRCSLEYAPVCGVIDGKKQEFPNLCFAHDSGATMVVHGSCTGGIGEEKDIHGCLPSEGFSWDVGLSSCTRAFERRSEVWQVFGTPTSCIGSGNTMTHTCLRVVFPGRSHATLHVPIKGFEPHPGYWYTLRVEVSRSAEPYRLIHILRQVAPSSHSYYRWSPFGEG